MTKQLPAEFPKRGLLYIPIYADDPRFNPSLAEPHGTIQYYYNGTNRPDKHSGIIEYCDLHPAADILVVGGPQGDIPDKRLWCSVCGAVGVNSSGA